MTKAIGMALVGLSVVCGCDGERGEKERSRQTNQLEQVFMTSESKVWATARDPQTRKISQYRFGYSNPGNIVTTEVFSDLPIGAKPFVVNIYYDKSVEPFNEVHVPEDYRLNTSSERVHRGKTTVEIDNVELGGQK